ncbi:MAG TPA: T9SS type A sorting domain-containing protein [Parafilimonas sp.]|nr:T9SS type A sorting domain-containing protein [Parafilimonas sp.]
MKLKLQLLQILFACLLITKIPAQDLYTGVWRAGTDGYALQAGLNWTDFKAQWTAYAKQNLRLVDVSTYTKGNKRYYNGVWRAGTDNYALLNGLNWTDFVAQWTSLAKQNLRLIDIETYMSGNTRLYLGVWRAGKDNYALLGGLKWADFTAQWSSLASQNLRLIDVASYLQNGTRLYTGVWRAGTDNYALLNGLEWNSFTTQWQQLASQNLRLINISSYMKNNKRLYLGVWRAGTGNYALWNGTDWESTVSKWAELGNANLRLINLETYETTCDATCLNHALMPDDLSTGWRDGYDYHITAGKYHCNGTPGSCDTGILHATDVIYRWPNLQLNGNYYLRNSVVFGAKDRIFTLPFKDAANSMGHNGWRYNNGAWHHAIDYYRNDKSTFQVVAAAAGKVIYIGWDYWSGNTMVISHNVGNKKDAYRTIYMHLQNGPTNDCGKAWSISVPKIYNAKDNSNQVNYKHYLNSTGCPETGQRNPQAAYWGTNSKKIDMSLLNKNVTAGQVIGWSGSTGPGGCGSLGGTVNVNTHLHIFFAYRDPTDDRWYFFDPYGIYSQPYCYPAGVNEAINGQCSRYPVAWKNGKPDYAVTTFDKSEATAASLSIATSSVSISPNPSVGNITLKYNTEEGGKIHITIYNKAGLRVYEKDGYAIKGGNSYYLNLSNAGPGVYYAEINNGSNAAKNNFIISR